MRCVSFLEFEEEVRRACGAEEGWQPPPQVVYLREFLTRGRRRAGTLIVEESHVDRHYLEEYSSYYSTKLRPPRSHTVRVHFFERAFSSHEVDAWIDRAIDGRDVDLLQESLGPHYLGFTTIRPIQDAPIGRTVLRPYDDRPSRCYRPATMDTRVHLLGTTLRVQGLPFQQQEQAVGACATTALWCALASAARATGHRAPTPFSVTTSATRHFNEARPFPAIEGLAASQFIAAIREAGFSPYSLKPGNDPSSFLMSLKTYVASGIPAILIVQDEGMDTHAMTVCGYREDDEEFAAPDISVDAGTVNLRSPGLSRLYIHDDREGPYVRMTVSIDSTSVRVHRFPYGRTAPDTEGANIWYAFFPLYPKLRLTARELVSVAGDLGRFVKFSLGDRADDCRIQTFFRLNGDYLSELYELGLDQARLRSFLKEAHFSRYVGVIRYCVGDDLVADVICDTTDIGRRHPSGGEVIAVAPFAESLRDRFVDYFHRRLPQVLVL